MVKCLPRRCVQVTMEDSLPLEPKACLSMSSALATTVFNHFTTLVSHMIPNNYKKLIRQAKLTE